MRPVPFPHRAGLLAPTLPGELPHAGATARLLLAMVREALLRHDAVALLDPDDDRLRGSDGALIDARHPEAEDHLDWQFRVARRRDVLWLDLSTLAAPKLRSRRPAGPIESFAAPDGATLSQQLDGMLAAWLAARRQGPVVALPSLRLAELADLARRLEATASAGADAVRAATVAVVAPWRATFLFALGALAPGLRGTASAALVELVPDHPLAQRAVCLARLRQPGADRRSVLPVALLTPADGKGYLPIWGGEAPPERPDEPPGLRYQGMAALLLPTNEYALHNFAVQLAEHGRLEESHRWADRAATLRPTFAAAQLDCARRMRRVGRAGHAIAEIAYRCDEVEAMASRGELPAADEPQRYHAALLRAFAHHDAGDLDDAIAVAERALAAVPTAMRGEFAWARARVDKWRSSPGALARAHATAAAIRRVPAEVIRGLALGRITDADELALLLEALLAIGEPGQAVVAFHQCAAGERGELLGDGKARLLAARALIHTGELAAALEQLQIVQLRRPQARLEAEIGRVLRLAATRPAAAWHEIIAGLRRRGAQRLAAMAARDLGDWVPGLRAPGPAATAAASQRDLAAVVARMTNAVPEAAPWAAAIVARLTPPARRDLAAADELAQEWWSVLVPPGKDRRAHAASAMLALALALDQYFRQVATGATPLAGAYRHIAVEALHLVRRARFQVEDRAVHGLLATLEAHAGVDEWLLDGWLLRVERALDLENEHGEKLVELTSDLPRVSALLRGDERIAWELRFAFDLASTPGQHEPAAMMFERALRGGDAGAGAGPWARLLLTCPAGPGALDEAWLVARAAQHPLGYAALARHALVAGHDELARDAATRALAAAPPDDRADVAALLASFAPGKVLAEPPPTTSDAALVRATIEVRAGRVADALRTIAVVDRFAAPRRVGRLVLEAGRPDEALTLLRYAAHRFTRPEEWSLLAVAAWHARRPGIAADAYQRYFETGGAAAPEMLAAYVSMLISGGRFTEAQPWAHRLVEASAQAPAYRAVALGSMAAVLLGQGRFAEAARQARDARTLLAGSDVSAMDDLLARCEARQQPARIADPDDAAERQAALALARGDLAAVLRLATGEDAERGGIVAAALHASAERATADDAPALAAASRVLTQTIGATSDGAVHARLTALRLREDAFILIDPPPVPRGPLDIAGFDAAFAARQRAGTNR